ncbi:hypothetical protein Trydic_g13771 [Trypoxylus dichotomus]
MGSALGQSLSPNTINSDTHVTIKSSARISLMCWWGFKVFLRVFGNLASRIIADTVDASYKICTTLLCPCRCSNTANSTVISVLPHQQRHMSDNSEMVHEFICRVPREQFYQDVGRDEVEVLLENKQNGTFIIRPSTLANSLGTLSIIQDNRIFHLNIRQKEDDTIALGSERINEKHFTDVNALINYHISNYLILYSNGETYRTLLLPYRG